MLACGWLKTQSPLLSLLFLIFKKDLKCLVRFQFCSSETVNKGHCWQSSVSPGKGWEGEGHSSLPGGLGWAGSCPVRKKSSLYWPPTTPAPEDRGDLKALLLTEDLRHPMYRATTWLCPPHSGHSQLWTKVILKLLTWLNLAFTIVKHHTSSTEPATATIIFIRDNVLCLWACQNS